MYDEMNPSQGVLAPYEMQTEQHFARGGRARHKDNKELIHLNTKEADILDHLQGFRKDDRRGARDYSGLEALIKNPHLVSHMHHHARLHRAGGGTIDPQMERFKEGGRFGDNEAALVGPETKKFLDAHAESHQPNPITGYPEYWSLGGALSGLWNTIKGGAQSLAPHIGSIAQAVAPTLMPMAQKALGDNFGDLGKMAGNALPGLANSVLGPQTQDAHPLARSIGEGLNSGIQGMQSGQTGRQAFGQGLKAAGQSYGGTMGNAVSNTGSSLAQGNSLGQSVKQGATNAFNNMGGMRGLGNVANNAYGAMRRGGLGAAGQAVTGQASKYLRPQAPQPMDTEDLGQFGRNMFNSPY